MRTVEKSARGDSTSEWLLGLIYLVFSLSHRARGLFILEMLALGQLCCS